MSKKGNEGPPQEGGDGAKKDENADIYENRGNKKIIRLVTVVAYMFSVSFVGIALSGYYLFLWQPPNPKLIRRAHFKADPQIEFLLSDPVILPNQSGGSLSELSAKEFLNVIASERRNSSVPQTSLTSRIADDFDADNLMDNHNYAAARKRSQLDQSLFVLRNSLIELLRGKVNNSTVDGNSSRRNEETSYGAKSALIEEGMKFKSSRAVDDTTKDFQTRLDETSTSKLEDSTMNDSTALLTLDSSTISGDEVHEHQFTITGNGTRHESFQIVHQVDYSSTVNTGAKRGNDSDYSSTNTSKEMDAIIATGSTSKDESIDTSIYRNSRDVTTPNSRIIPSDKDSVRDYITTVKTVENFRPSIHITLADNKDVRPKTSTTDQTYVDHSTSNETIVNASRNVVSRDRLDFSQRSNVSSGKLASTAVNSEEMQVERMTTKLMTMDEEDPRKLIPTTTQRPKDLLRILTEIASTKTSTTPPLSVAPEDLRTESSTSTESHPETTT